MPGPVTLSVGTMLAPLVADFQGSLIVVGVALLKLAGVFAVLTGAVWFFGFKLGGIEKITGRRPKIRYVARPKRRRKYGVFLDWERVPGGSAFARAGQVASRKYGATSLGERQLMSEGSLSGAMFDIFHDVGGPGEAPGVMSYSDDPNDPRNYPDLRRVQENEFGDEDLDAERDSGESASLDSAGL